jgi:hypothetical protein
MAKETTHYPPGHPMRQTHGVGERQGQVDLGKRSKITRAKRKAPAAAAGEPGAADPVKLMQEQFLARLNTDLRSNGRPTLADRVRKEGARAYGERYPRKKKKKKPTAPVA